MDKRKKVQKNSNNANSLGNLKVPSKERLESLNTAGVHRRVALDRMDDAQAPKPGTQTLIVAIDDIGDLICEWDNGSSLKLILEKDQFHIIKSDEEIKKSLSWHKEQQDEDSNHMLKCPRCGESLWKDGSSFGRYPAISRLADVMVCSECGAQESLIAADTELKLQGAELNIFGANESTKRNLQRKNLKDWHLVREWEGIDEG